MGSPSPSKLPLPTAISGTSPNTWFLGPTQVLNPKQHLDRFSHFRRALQDRQTDRPTHHATRSVTIGRIYARTAMQPNNDNQAYSEYKHSLTSRVRRYVVTATKAVHQVQIRPIMRNYHTVPFPQVTSGSAQ